MKGSVSASLSCLSNCRLKRFHGKLRKNLSQYYRISAMRAFVLSNVLERRKERVAHICSLVIRR